MDTLQVTISGAQLALLQYFHDRYDRDHSLTYTFEECLVAGIEAKKRSKEYSEATNNRKKFEKEIAANPGIVLKPVEMLALMKKYGIGSSNAKLEEQVMEAAEKLEEAELEKATAPASETETPTEKAA
jgi:uncharacterized protein YneF (UPF0154 family)